MRRRSRIDVMAGILARSGGLRARADAHCVSCVYDEMVSGTWRQQVEDCQVTLCALWEVRPRSSGNKGRQCTASDGSTPTGCEVGRKSGVVVA